MPRFDPIRDRLDDVKGKLAEQLEQAPGTFEEHPQQRPGSVGEQLEQAPPSREGEGTRDEFVERRGSASKNQLLVPGQSIEVSFEPRAGTVDITVLSRSKDLPVGDDGVKGKPQADPDAPHHAPFEVQGLPVRVVVTRPDGSREEFDLDDTNMDMHGPGAATVTLDVPSALEKRTWRVVVTNVSQVRASAGIVATFTASRHLVHTTRIPVSLLNGAARELLKGLGLQVHLDQDGSFIDFSEDLKAHAGGVLERREFTVPVLEDINLRTVLAEVSVEDDGDRPRVFFDVYARFEEGGKEINFGPIESDLVYLAVRFRFEVFFAKVARDIRLRYRATVDTGALKVGNRVLEFIVDVALGAVGLVTRIGEFFGFTEEFDVDDLGELLEEKGEGVLNAASTQEAVGRFLTAGIMHLAHQGHQMHGFQGSGSDLVVKHFDPDREEDGESPPPPRVLLPRETATVREQDTRGARLLREKIDHIVVLMLENRSFDHLLGHLSLDEFGREEVEGLTGDETNSAGPTGPVIPVEEQSETRFPFSPDHSFDGIAEQVNDGRMDGFVRSFFEKEGHQAFIVDVNPMGYYTGATLPAHGFLARHHLICNHWYPSHPGATWANRFCTEMGATPVLRQHEVTKRDIGYVPFATVFDLLDRRDWVNYESDVAFLRLFERYRLDVENIRPIDEFFDRARAGQLPLFTFIDPDYADVVPVDRIANDDHPPADLLQGQRLVERIYNALRESPRWDRTLFVLTYDEHGGFFDHVPPPGTSLNPDDSIPLVHPEGRASLGPRVPAMVISPWVDAGVTNDRFEHTSIIKTVLLRRFGPEHPDMGQRVQQSNNLGDVLTASAPRLVPPMPPVDPPRPEVPPEIGPKPRADDFHERMRRFGTPDPAPV